MPMFSECCTQGDDKFPVDMFCCQVCGQSRCSGCQYGDRIDLTNITGFKGTGNVCKTCLTTITEPPTENECDLSPCEICYSSGHPTEEHDDATMPRHQTLEQMAGDVSAIPAPPSMRNGKLRPKPYSETLAIMELGKLDYERMFGSAEMELATELRNQGAANEPEPVCCPTCQGELYKSQGMVGERVMVCQIHGMVWEDHEDAIRRVI